MIGEQRMEQQPRKMNAFDWVLIFSTLALAVLFVISGILPNLPLFQATIFGQDIPLFMLSVWAWLFLFWIITNVKRMTGVRFTRSNKIALLVALSVLLLYYAYSLMTRQFIYYWDYVLYYRMQVGISKSFHADGFFNGIIDVIKSVWYNSYSLLNNVFLAAPYTFVPRTPNLFVAISAASILPSLYFLIAMFIKVVERFIQPKHGSLFFIGGMTLAVGFPLIHRALLFGQPDLLGLIFVFLIILLTISYDFSKTDFLRYFLLIVLIIMTCASRRWYMFWLVAYFVCYGVYVILQAILKKRWSDVKRTVLFTLATGLTLAVVFLPMIIVVLRAHYSVSYSAYNVSGFSGELKSQAQYLGIGLLAVILTGTVYGIVKSKTRALTIFALIDVFFTIFIFTRIQNMGYHHTLILVPAYLLLMLICFGGICRLEKRWMLALSSTVVLGFCGVNAAVCATSSAESLPSPFSNVALIPPQRTDIQQIRAVNRWILEHCSKGESAYIIPHGYPYNPDVFRSCDYPDFSVSKHVPYGSAVLGTHYFPDDLLLAKYVLTCEPFCNLSLAEKYNTAFLSEIPQKHFTQVAQFDMGNGYIFYVYERILPMDREEIQFYQDTFAQESKQFPELFSVVWDELIKELK